MKKQLGMKYLFLLIIMMIYAAACSRTADLRSPVERIPEEERTAADQILLGARQEVQNRTRYDASYVALSYPGGDVPADRGACTDVVVVRALRKAGFDLQVLIHEDMTAHFPEYPALWDLTRPDPSIGHFRFPAEE